MCLDSFVCRAKVLNLSLDLGDQKRQAKVQLHTRGKKGKSKQQEPNRNRFFVFFLFVFVCVFVSGCCALPVSRPFFLPRLVLISSPSLLPSEATCHPKQSTHTHTHTHTHLLSRTHTHSLSLTPFSSRFFCFLRHRTLWTHVGVLVVSVFSVRNNQQHQPKPPELSFWFPYFPHETRERSTLQSLAGTARFPAFIRSALTQQATANNSFPPKVGRSRNRNRNTQNNKTKKTRQTQTKPVGERSSSEEKQV